MAQTVFGGGEYDAFVACLCLNICEGKTIGLGITATSTTTTTCQPLTFTPTIVNSCDTTGYQYLWTFTGGNPTSSTAVNPTVSFSSPGNYDVKLVVTTLCKKDSVTKPSYITVTSCSTSCTLSAGAAVLTNVTCNDTSTGSATATISNGTGGPYTYSWSNGMSSITNSTTQQISNLTIGTYTITVIDATSCVSTSTVIITEPDVITTSTLSTPTLCGAANGSATVTAGGGSPVFIYTWSNNTTGQTGTNLSAASYTVTVIDSKGCTVTTTATINNTNLGTINIMPAQQTINGGNSVSLTVSGATSYTWSPALGLSCTNCSNPTASPAISTTYTITATDINGCAITAMITITVKQPCAGNEDDVYIANIFSPNNDGKNDVLYIEGDGLTNIYWAIYDRWGNLLFEAFDQTHGWDGTKKANPMESGTYVYYLKATCVKTNTEVKLKGNVSIVK